MHNFHRVCDKLLVLPSTSCVTLSWEDRIKKYWYFQPWNNFLPFRVCLRFVLLCSPVIHLWPYQGSSDPVTSRTNFSEEGWHIIVDTYGSKSILSVVKKGSLTTLMDTLKVCEGMWDYLKERVERTWTVTQENGGRYDPRTLLCGSPERSFYGGELLVLIQGLVHLTRPVVTPELPKSEEKLGK